jgi:carbon storage regulator CsrA
VLLLRRRVGESIVIGGNVRVTVSELRGGAVRLAIEAPSTMPVYRGELLDVIAPENESAASLSQSGEMRVSELSEIEFPHMIPGLGQYTQFVLYDVSESIRALVAKHDRTISILLTDPTALCPNYPVAAALARFPFGGTDLAIAVVMRRPADGSMPTVNLAAPIVIDLETRRGAQVILDDPSLPLRAPLIASPSPEVHSL